MTDSMSPDTKEYYEQLKQQRDEVQASLERYSERNELPPVELIMEHMKLHAWVRSLEREYGTDSQWRG